MVHPVLPPGIMAQYLARAMRVWSETAHAAELERLANLRVERALKKGVLGSQARQDLEALQKQQAAAAAAKAKGAKEAAKVAAAAAK